MLKHRQLFWIFWAKLIKFALLFRDSTAIFFLLIMVNHCLYLGLAHTNIIFLLSQNIIIKKKKSYLWIHPIFIFKLKLLAFVSKVAALRGQRRLAASHNELRVPLQLRVLHRPLHVYKPITVKCKVIVAVCHQKLYFQLFL